MKPPIPPAACSLTASSDVGPARLSRRAVLAGISVPPEDQPQLGAALADLGYPYVDETANPACRLFLDGA